MADRPERTEYAEHFHKYISLVPDGPIAATLAAQTAEALALYRGITEAQSTHRYAEGKWTIKQVLGHVIDTERVFNYRALAFSRDQTQVLPGFDQDVYVASAAFDDRPWHELVNDLVVVRAASLRLVESFTPEMLLRAGEANRGRITVRACAFVIAGHELYHIARLHSDYGIPHTSG